MTMKDGFLAPLRVSARNDTAPVILRLVLNEVKERDEESGMVRGLEGQIASPPARNDGRKRLAMTRKAK